MNIVIDLSSVQGANGLVNPLAAMWFIFTQGGWVVLIPVFVWGFYMAWLEYARNRFAAAQKYVLLAIDVPKENEQSPKAVEHVFAHLSGIYKKGNIKERFIEGYTQHVISLELVSIEGYVQFLVRAHEKFRDLIEAALYAQYPNAEITEVDDYTHPFRVRFPNEEYNMWGTELRLTNKQYYPLRTYPSFEHALSQTFLDPMASILEIFSRLGRGEQVWLQILIAPPISDKWRQAGVRLIKRLIGARGATAPGALSWLPTQVAQGLYESATASIITPSEFGTSDQRQNQPPSLMLHIPPHERTVIEQVGIKISKIVYESKVRLLYLAKHDVFNKDRAPALLGAMKQFNSLDMNGLLLDRRSKTNLDFFFVNYRQNSRRRRLLYGYKYRSIGRGWNKFILNVEELATLFHFPVTTVVKAPRIQKTESKRGEPPAALPVETEFSRVQPFTPGKPPPVSPQPVVSQRAELPVVPPAPPSFLPTPPVKRGSAPPNLPV